MKTTIATNQYYDLACDEAKNRIYLTLRGFWPNKSAVPNYIADVTKATRNVKSGYTILTDLRSFKTAPEEIGELHKQAQGILVKAGLGRTAEVLSSAMKIEEIALDKYSKSSGMKRMTFHDVMQANSWLDAG